MRCIICLDGNSSAITNKSKILYNITYVLNLLGIPFEVYEPRNDGFKKFYDDMNQPNTLYILNDSLCYHLCEQKCILLCRSIPWVTSSSKPNCIGRITHEMMACDATFLMALIYRNEPIRQERDSFAAFTYCISNDYSPTKIDVMARHAQSTWSMAQLSKHDMHFTSAYNYQDGLAEINKVLEDGVDLLKHPDDILIVVNRDICLIKECTGILRAFMDSLNIDCCFAHRVDVRFNGLLNFDAINDKPVSSGIDFFAFRKSATVIPELINTRLLIGRVGWDTFWASKIKNRIPFNICYHYPHKSDWQTASKQKENALNIETIVKSDPNLRVNAFNTKAWFEKII